MIKINTEGLKSIIAKSIKCCANNRMLPLTAMVRIEAFKDDEISLTTTNMRDFLKVTYSIDGNFDEASASGAFDVVSDGQINLTPNSTAKKAAQDALNGWDPSYGAIYYFNPSTATNKWIWSRPMTITIGKHRFCK